LIFAYRFKEARAQGTRRFLMVTRAENKKPSALEHAPGFSLVIVRLYHFNDKIG
jgi:hypothetical protein